MAKQDYFTSKENSYSYTFPDGESRIDFRGLVEKDRMKMSSKQRVVMDRNNTGKVEMDLSIEGEGLKLVKLAAIGWNLVRAVEGKEEAVPFTTENLDKMLENLDPALIDEMEVVIRKNNAWLRGKKK